MRGWKLLALIAACVMFLGGCGTDNTSPKEAVTVTEQVEMAVPDKGIPVLMYHMIGVDPDDPHNQACLREEHFRAQMKFLKDNDFHPITMDQLYEYMVHHKPVPVRPVVLTFDDGYADTYSIVMPVMKEYGFACTVFIPTYDADKGTRLTWQQIKEMHDAGIQIASHSYHHERVNEQGPDTLAKEIAKSQEELKAQLGIDNAYFCYPYGGNSPAAAKALQAAGIKLAFTMNPGWAKYGDDPYAVKRIWIGNEVDIDNFRQRITTEQYEQR